MQADRSKISWSSSELIPLKSGTFAIFVCDRNNSGFSGQLELH